MSQIVKQTIKVTLSFILLIAVFIGFMFANPSLAWFAKNEKVSAKGLSANVKVSPNLIIAKSINEIEQKDYLTFDVNFKGTAQTNMIAVTHDNDVPNTFLKYLVNHYAVDMITGNAKPGSTLEFENVPTTNNEAYFIDYVIYIASAFEALEIESLKASLITPDATEVHPPYFYAASVDFYLEEISLDAYMGTTSVAKSVNTPTEKSVELFPDGTTVPLNTDGYITVIMRCYFDGDLQNPQTGNAYINSHTVKSNGVVIGVEFVAKEKEPEA